LSRPSSRTLFLSPHLDDVVLSCGGLLQQQARQGLSPLVLTCFAGVPDYRMLSSFAEGQHRRWGQPEDPVRDRRAEDAAALDSLGVAHEHWPYLDCIYRLRSGSKEFLYASEEALFGEVDPSETALAQDLARRLRRRFERAGLLVYAPLSAGAHVDHQLVRMAAQQLQESGYSITCYEDYPYSESPGELTVALNQWTDSLKPFVVPLSQEDVEAKVSAIRLYSSQVSVLFGGEQFVSLRVTSYSRLVGGGVAFGERYYQ